MKNYEIVSFYTYDKFYTVYKGIDKRTHQQILLKVISQDFYYASNFSLRFDLWSGKLLALKSDTLVRYLDFVKELKEFIIVNEYFEPSPLSDVLKKQQFTPGQIKRIFLQILRGYEDLHENNIIHGEPDPGKIHIYGDLSVKQEDLGLRNLLFNGITLEHRYFYVKDVRFFSPEQFTQKYADHRSDIYSLGVLLYYLIEGKTPYDHIKGKDEIKQAVVNQAFPMPERFDFFNSIIAKATHKNPDNRYQTIMEMIEHTENIELPQEKQEKPQTQPKPEPRLDEKQLQTLDRKRYVSFLKKYLALLFFVVMISASLFFIVDLWHTFQMPAKAKNYLITGKVTDLKAFNFLNSTYVNGKNDTSLLFITIDSLENTKGAKVLVTEQANDFYITFNNGIFYVCGSKKLGSNLTVPALLIVYPDHYEPYYDSETYGKYQSVDVVNGKMFLLKHLTEPDLNIIEIRDLDMNLLDTVPLEILPELDNHPTEIHVRKNKIYLISHISKANSQTVEINCIDTTGRLIWTQSYKSQRLSELNNCKNIALFDDKIMLGYLEKPDMLRLKTFDSNGHNINDAKIDLPFNALCLQKLLPLSDGTVLGIFPTSKNTRIVRFDDRGDVFWTKKISYAKNIRIFDAIVSPDNKILLLGQAHYKYMDLLAQQEVYFLYTAKVDKNGNFPPYDFKSMVNGFLGVKKIPVNQ